MSTRDQYGNEVPGTPENWTGVRPGVTPGTRPQAGDQTGGDPVEGQMGEARDRTRPPLDPNSEAGEGPAVEANEGGIGERRPRTPHP